MPGNKEKNYKFYTTDLVGTNYYMHGGFTCETLHTFNKSSKYAVQKLVSGGRDDASSPRTLSWSYLSKHP